MLRRISLGFYAQLVTLAVAFADRIVLVGILLRAWGADVYADWAILAAGAGLIAFGECGLNIYFGNRWQGALARGDEASFQRLVGVSMLTYLTLGAGLAVAVAVFALAGDVGATLSLRLLEGHAAAAVFLVLGAATLSRVMRGSISQIYRARGRFADGILADALPMMMSVLLVALAGLAGAQVVAVALTYLVADVLFGWGGMVWDLRRRYPALSFRPAVPSGADLRDLLGKLPWYAVVQGLPFVWLQVPILAMGHLGLSGAALVSFVVARTLVNFVRQLATMLSLSTAAEAAGAYHAGKAADVDSMLSGYGRFLAGVAGAVAGGLAIFAQPLIVAWTGNAELARPDVVLWLLAPLILVAPAMPLSALLSYVNLPRPVVIAGLVQAAVGLGLCWALGSRYGVAGVAAGLAIGEAMAMGLVFPALAGRSVAFAYRAYLMSSAAAFVLASLWGAGAAVALIRLGGDGSMSLLLLSCAAWGLLVLIPVGMFALSGRLAGRGTPARWAGTEP